MHNVIPKPSYANAVVTTRAQIVMAKAAARRLARTIALAEQAHYDNAADEVAQLLAAADSALDHCVNHVQSARVAFDVETQRAPAQAAA